MRFPALGVKQKKTKTTKKIATYHPLFPVRSMYFGFIYDTRAKTPLTEETKDIFVTDIRNESRIKAEQNRDVLTLTRAFYSYQVLLFLTKRSSSYINIICCQI